MTKIANQAVHEILADSRQPEPWKLGLSAPKVDLDVARRLRFLQTPIVAPSGAMATNIGFEETGRGHLRISAQRDGEKLVRRGILYRNTLMIDDGLRAFRWGFGHQAADGSFPSSAHGPHSANFMIAAASHSEHLLRHSHFAEYDLPAREVILSGLEAAARWYCGPGWQIFWRRNQTMPHQAWLVAATLANIHALRPDPEAMRLSRLAVELTIRAQAEDGYYPENDGSDTNYHAVSLIWAQRWLLRCFDDPLALPVSHSISKAVAWQRSKLSASGTIDGNDNTRTGPWGADGRDRNGKGQGAMNTARILATWSTMIGDSTLWDEASLTVETIRRQSAGRRPQRPAATAPEGEASVRELESMSSAFEGTNNSEHSGAYHFTPTCANATTPKEASPGANRDVEGKHRLSLQQNEPRDCSNDIVFLGGPLRDPCVVGISDAGTFVDYAEKPLSALSYSARLVDSPEVFVGGVNGARIVTDRFVVCVENKIIGETIPRRTRVKIIGKGAQAHHFRSRLKQDIERPAGQKIAGTSALLVQANRNYGHWHMDVLPSLAVLQDLQILEKLTLLTSDLHSYRRRSLELLGVDLSKVQEIGESNIYCERLLVPSPMATQNAHVSFYNRNVYSRIVEAVLRANICHGRRFNGQFIYLDRSNASKRRCLNEVELIERLREEGFTIVRTEELDYDQQVLMFVTADVIVGPMGAALVNVAFCKRGAIVIELKPPGHEKTRLWNVYASRAGAVHHAIRFPPDAALQGDTWMIPDVGVLCDDIKRLIGSGAESSSAERDFSLCS